MSNFNPAVLKNKAVLIFIILVAFAIVILGVVTFTVHFSNSKESSTGSKSTSKNSSTSKTNLDSNNIRNVRNDIINESNLDLPENNINSLTKNIQGSKAKDSGLLSNVKDGSYKNFQGKQVFNVSNNIFTYNDAKAVCKAHGAELATYEQVMDAYKNGAEWCNYGWSDKQMALYPTQKKTWEKLQEDPENANICGEWGVNGGYFENPNTLFGANCYGVKPEPKDRERLGTPPVSEKEQDLLAAIARFKNEKADLTINPYNKDNWSSK